MKKIYIAIVLLIICSGVCIIEQVTINKVCSETTSIINTALYLNEQKAKNSGKFGARDIRIYLQ